MAKIKFVNYSFELSVFEKNSFVHITYTQLSVPFINEQQIAYLTIMNTDTGFKTN